MEFLGCITDYFVLITIIKYNNLTTCLQNKMFQLHLMKQINENLQSCLGDKFFFTFFDNSIYKLRLWIETSKILSQIIHSDYNLFDRQTLNIKVTRTNLY